VGLEDDTKKWLSISDTAVRKKVMPVKAHLKTVTQNLSIKVLHVLDMPQAICRILITST
jgi:hypothetical protein